MASLNSAQSQARRAASASMPWVERLARLGYAAKGMVYVLIGVLVIQAAFGAGTTRVDQQTVFQKILQQPFGQFLLAVVAVGLAGYALWRLIQAMADPEREGQKKNGALTRVGYFISAVSYGALSFIAFQLVRGRSAGQKAPSDFTATLMRQPAGRWLVLLIGLALLVVGIMQIYQAYQARFERHFKTSSLSASEKHLAITLGRIGYAAKGVVLIIIAYYMTQAALQFNPQKAVGLGDTFSRIASQPYGTLVLAVIAMGMVAYGLYALFLSQFRRISVA